MAPRYADKTECQGRGVYLFMAVGACTKATAFSMGGIGAKYLYFILLEFPTHYFEINLDW